jgi:U4/U6.U5 tri-snRNP-associated protein 3
LTYPIITQPYRGAQVPFDADITAEEMQVMVAMGIPFGFETTAGKHVEGDAANAGAVKAKKTRRARQYMNRRGGFNRPLPAEKTGEIVYAS